MVIRRRTKRKLMLWLLIFSLIFAVFVSPSAAGRPGCWKVFGFRICFRDDGD
ncbi:MAG: hypothetical protein JWN15_4391 [Firmicutes bacterium]|nr:hypothetical protein [Bacillota bacterium]